MAFRVYEALRVRGWRFVARRVFFVSHNLVILKATVDIDLDNSRGHRLNELMIVSGEDHIPLKASDPVIDGTDRLEIQVIRWAVKHDHVGARQHHLG